MQEAEQNRVLPAQPGEANIRDLDRDRAILIHLLDGKNARDSRLGVGWTPRERTRAFGNSNNRFEAELDAVERTIDILGQTQSGLLMLLGRHVACIKHFVSVTGDRRLLEYRTTRVVEELYLFARVWSLMEHDEILHQLTRQAGSNSKMREERRLLKVHARRLARALDVFATWAHEFSSGWTATSEPIVGPWMARELTVAARTEPTTSTSVPTASRRPDQNSARHIQVAMNAGNSTVAKPTEGSGHSITPNMPCHTYNRNNDLFAFIESLLGVGQNDDFETSTYGNAEVTANNFGRHGFTPYLVTFVAQTLSALDDHAAALRLLINWQSDLKNLVEIAQQPGLMPTMVDNSLALNDRALREVLKLSESWYNLSSFIDIVLLQQLSENSDLARPPTQNGLAHLVTALFPAVLDIFKEDRLLSNWRENPGISKERLAFYSETHSWRQSLVLSYAGWVKVYLDLRNRNFIQPTAVRPNDIELAKMLGSLDLNCFRDELRSSWDVDEQRANFTLTEAQIRMNELAQDSIESRQRDNLRLMLLRNINRTIDDLMRRDRNTEPKSSLENLVFGQGDTRMPLLDSARSLKIRLDAFHR